VATAPCLKTLRARITAVPAARASRRAALVLASASSLTLALVCAAPAPAQVSEISGTSVGLQPRLIGEAFDGEKGATFNNPAGNPVLHASRVYVIYWDPTDHYHGDWQHVIDQFMTNMAGMSGSLNSVFAADEQYTDSSNQPAYNKITFRGAYTDTKAYPGAGCTDPKPLGPKDRITCLTDQQLQEELASFIGEHGLQKGMGSIFYLLTPPGVTVCVGAGGAGSGHCSDYSGKVSEESYANSFCSYHSAINPTNPTSGDGNTVLYAAIPWTAGGYGDYHLEEQDETPGFDCQDGSGVEQEPNQVPCPSPDGACDLGLADLIINQIAVEQQNIVTDPLLNAWQDSSHRESTDECRNFFAPAAGAANPKEGSKAGTLSNQAFNSGSYYLNDAFNLAALKLPYPAIPCVTGVRLVPQFTSPSPVNSGDIVALNGMESLLDLNAVTAFGASAPISYATYAWNFGDGTPAVSGYAPGAPACTVPWLSPCAASVFHAYQYGGTYNATLTVTDAVGHKASVSNPIVVLGPPPPPPARGAGAGAGSGAAVGAPAATVVVLSHSLRQVLRSGLLISYSVSERVTGRFEVLIDKKVAHKLHLRAPSATGLAPGTPAQMVIGKSILVTLGGGHSRMKIQLPRSFAARLEHLHSVALILRLVVRNAGGGEATIVTPLKLSH
jgi:PKD domain